MAKPSNHKQIVLANRLTDGVVVYLSPKGDWVERLQQAAVAYDDASRAALEAQAQTGLDTQQIAGWEFTDVAEEGAEIHILKNKQFIQSLGPTVRRDLGKQADLAA